MNKAVKLYIDNVISLISKFDNTKLEKNAQSLKVYIEKVFELPLLIKPFDVSVFKDCLGASKYIIDEATNNYKIIDLGHREYLTNYAFNLFNENTASTDGSEQAEKFLLNYFYSNRERFDMDAFTSMRTSCMKTLANFSNDLYSYLSQPQLLFIIEQRLGKYFIELDTAVINRDSPTVIDRCKKDISNLLSYLHCVGVDTDDPDFKIKCIQANPQYLSEDFKPFATKKISELKGESVDLTHSDDDCNCSTSFFSGGVNND